MNTETVFHCTQCDEEWVCYEDEELSTECPDCGSLNIEKVEL